MSGPGLIVVVGSLNEDYVVSVERRPGPGETVADAVLHREPGGKGANQAVAAARLGTTVEMVACVADDASGDMLLDSLSHNGVGCRHVVKTDAAASGAAFITLTPDGENSIVVAPGANALLDGTHIEAAAAALGAADVLLVQLEVPLATVQHALEVSGEHTVVMLNASPARSLPQEMLARVDVVVVNEHEAAALLASDGLGRSPTGTEATSDASAGAVTADPEAAAVQLCKLGPAAAVITLGPAGAVAAVDEATWSVPAGRVEVLDTTGAGDVFAGALASWLVDASATRHPESLVRHLPIAVAAAVSAAGVSVTRAGAYSSYPLRSALGAPWE